MRHSFEVLAAIVIGLGCITSCSPENDSLGASKASGEAAAVVSEPADEASDSREAVSNAEPAADEYKPLDPKELNCSATLSGRLSWSADRKMNGTIDELICNDVSIPLAGGEVVDSSLTTRDFGVFLLKPGNATAFTMQLWLTDKQKEKLKEWVKTNGPKEAETPRGQQAQQEDYEFVPPSELRLELRDFYYNGVVASDGVKPNGGEIGELLCGVKPIALRASEFNDGYIVTRDFGKIQVRFSSSLTHTGFAVFLKPTQKAALAEYCSS